MWRFIVGILCVWMWVSDGHGQHLLQNLYQSDADLNRGHDSLEVSCFKWFNPGYESLLAQLDSLDWHMQEYFDQPPNRALEQQKIQAAEQIRKLRQLVQALELQDSFTRLNDTCYKRLIMRREPGQDLKIIQLQGFSQAVLQPKLPDHMVQIGDREKYEGFVPAMGPEFWERLQVDLGLGFTQFFSRPHTYFVTPQGQVSTGRAAGGVQLLLSAHAMYRLNRQESVLLSLPLFTLSAMSDHKLGLLGKRMACGLGYARYFGPVAAYVSLLTAPYPYWDPEILQVLHLDASPYSEPDLSSWPSQIRYHLIGSFGLSIPLYATSTD